MVITESVESDSGQYFCYAKNAHGMSPTKNVKVIVSEDNANGKSFLQMVCIRESTKSHL